ncbi:MAG: hypothetical protein Ct9H300mP16_02340 [Pseudomonadota bacterium]|nr:MAG: hypothetical protein Ct9H300mP16_02340 [Pseudomonadota bacterium]
MVIGCGGGISVLISDALDSAGLSMARLESGTLSALEQFGACCQGIGRYRQSDRDAG